MRKISANLILPVSSAPLRNGIIIINTDGSIAELIDTAGNLKEEPGLEFYPGTITPGFVIPWFRLDEYSIPGQQSPDQTPSEFQIPSENQAPPEVQSPSENQAPPEFFLNSIKKLEQDLLHKGIKGMGLILTERMISDELLEQLSRSRLSFHPVLELCPDRDEEEFEVFHRGIELISRAFNMFNLSCSLTACSPALEYSDIGRFVQEYVKSHKNVLPPEGEKTDDLSPSGIPRSINLENILQSSPERDFEELLRQITLEAAEKIFEDDVLGSIEKGKTPGINLIRGHEKGTPHRASEISIKVLE